MSTSITGSFLRSATAAAAVAVSLVTATVASIQPAEAETFRHGGGGFHHGFGGFHHGFGGFHHGFGGFHHGFGGYGHGFYHRGFGGFGGYGHRFYHPGFVYRRPVVVYRPFVPPRVYRPFRYVVRTPFFGYGFHRAHRVWGPYGWHHRWC